VSAALFGLIIIIQTQRTRKLQKTGNPGSVGETSEEQGKCGKPELANRGNPSGRDTQCSDSQRKAVGDNSGIRVTLKSVLIAANTEMRRENTSTQPLGSSLI
jgi:hypothetical protein